MAHLPYLSHDLVSGSDIMPCNKIDTDLRSRSALAVKCKIILHCLEVNCKEIKSHKRSVGSRIDLPLYN